MNRPGWAAAILAVLLRPWLWWTALRQGLRLAGPRWWRRPPYVPLPDREYLRFRMLTAYGDPTAAPLPADLVSYLEWCRAWPRR